jgi:hypothetical protein
MQPKEIIEKLRLTFNELVNNQPAPVQLATAKLMDGTEVEVTELAIGGIVTIQGVPAPIGEHQLEDGTIIVVGDNGAITEIKPATTEEPVVEDMSSLFSAFQASTNEKFAAYEQRFADYETKLNNANSIINQLLDVTKTLAETPTGTPDQAVKTQNNFKVEKEEKSYSVLFS